MYFIIYAIQEADAETGSEEHKDDWVEPVKGKEENAFRLWCWSPPNQPEGLLEEAQQEGYETLPVQCGAHSNDDPLEETALK